MLKRVGRAVLEAYFESTYPGGLLFVDIVRMTNARGLRSHRPMGWLSGPGSGESLQIDTLFVRDDS